MTTFPAILPPVKSNALPFAAGLYPIDRFRRAPKGGCHIAGRAFAGGQFIGSLEIDADQEQAEPGPVVVSIHGFRYAVEGISIPAEEGSHAFELHKFETNHRYLIVRDNFGQVTCDCADYTFTKEGTGRMCKHGAKLAELGYLTLRSPAPAPAQPAPRRARRFEPSPDDNALAAIMFN